MHSATASEGGSAHVTFGLTHFAPWLRQVVCEVVRACGLTRCIHWQSQPAGCQGLSVGAERLAPGGERAGVLFVREEMSALHKNGGGEEEGGNNLAPRSPQGIRKTTHVEGHGHQHE